MTFNTTDRDGSAVNAHDPVLPSNQTAPIEVLENTAVGSVVVQFTATDEDVTGANTALQSFTYSFGVDVDGLLIQRYGPFFLNASTGELTVCFGPTGSVVFFLCVYALELSEVSVGASIPLIILLALFMSTA